MRLPDEWTVFPLHPIVGEQRSDKRIGSDGLPKRPCGCGDETCTQAGKHPQIFQWGELESGRKVVAKDPAAGFGLATGARSGIVVVDLDYKGPETRKPVNGVETFAALIAGLGVPWPETLTVRTGGRGAHLYFKWPGWKVSNSAGAIGPGIDVRGDGGFVVIPDTEHDSGNRYEFLNWGTPIAALPDWLAARLARSPGADDAPFPIPQLPLPGGVCTTEDGWKLIDKVVKEILAIPHGQRNERLFQKVAKLGDAVYVGFVALDDARYSVLRAVQEAGWGDPAKTADTVERALKGSSKGRVVEVAVNHRPANDRAIDLLAFDESVYVVGDTLARDTGVGISSMTMANLSETLSASVDYRKKDKDGNLCPAQVPDWAVREIYDRGHWPGLRQIDGFSAVPVLRPDMSVAWEKGYDGGTRVLIGNTCPEIPMSVEEASDILAEIVCDVPFASASHRAAWLAAALTPIAMYAFEGALPIFMFEGSGAGAGKTNLATICSMISAGIEPSVQTYSPDDDEMRKVITAHARNPSPVMFFDDVATEFGGGPIRRLVTAKNRMWKDRVLGSNDTFEGKVNSVIYVTLNNGTIGPDLERRICPIRITPLEVQPENRTGFKHDPWLPWVDANKHAFTWACLTLLRNPNKPTLQGWGSFEPWRDLVLGAVAAAGWGTVDSAVLELRERAAKHLDVAESLVEAMIDATQKACFIKDIWPSVYPPGGFGRPAEGFEKLRMWCEDNCKNPTKTWLGLQLNKYIDKATTRGTIRKGSKTDGYTKWWVQT